MRGGIIPGSMNGAIILPGASPNIPLRVVAGELVDEDVAVGIFAETGIIK